MSSILVTLGRAFVNGASHELVFVLNPPWREGCEHVIYVRVRRKAFDTYDRDCFSIAELLKLTRHNKSVYEFVKKVLNDPAIQLFLEVMGMVNEDEVHP